ncbi:hypothetical protein XI03_26025 [Bradyrhizobium sp. CCBAU 65884]|uniref:hypothetical protein n=1 Tax=Bradyrhizobium sp. CCBAU 65884 TaxID=722477 RepID=UPI0023052B17|nr:hypothetical protein [Bradyrhizobium sp. CCBAU 65884]MDA9477876.1 hypothetical protein [Bradyrhizobium sp. CCBAU 65884]
MSYPTKYTRQYDYVSYQNANPTRPLPAGQLHSDLNLVAASLAETIDFIKTAIRSDGQVANEAIGWDQLALDVKASIGDTTSVDAILAAKDDAEAAAGAASTSATNAATSATAAATSATNAASSATAASGSATAAATSASNAASTLANAVVGAAASVDSELMLFSGTTGKAAKRSNSLNGTIQVTGGVVNADAQLFSNIPQNAQSGTYTLVASDAQKHIYHNAIGAHTYTIPANASVAYPIGTTVTFVNETGSGNLTIAITSDTLMLAGTGATGSRSLSAAGIATAMKISSTKWIISGTGLS